MTDTKALRDDPGIAHLWREWGQAALGGDADALADLAATTAALQAGRDPDPHDMRTLGAAVFLDRLQTTESPAHPCQD